MNHHFHSKSQVPTYEQIDFILKLRITKTKGEWTKDVENEKGTTQDQLFNHQKPVDSGQEGN